MFFRSTPLSIAALTVLAAASLVLSGCGGGGGSSPKPSDAKITSVTVYPNLIPAAGGHHYP